MANSTEQIRLIKPEDTGTIINIISELENMKDTYLVLEKRKVGQFGLGGQNMTKVLEIVKSLEFLREIARSLDDEGKNKERLEEVRSITTDEILAQQKESNRVNAVLNIGIVVITLGALALIPLLF
jgi:hypothetical protein